MITTQSSIRIGHVVCANCSYLAVDINNHTKNKERGASLVTRSTVLGLRNAR